MLRASASVKLSVLTRDANSSPVFIVIVVVKVSIISLGIFLDNLLVSHVEATPRSTVFSASIADRRL